MFDDGVLKSNIVTKLGDNDPTAYRSSKPGFYDGLLDSAIEHEESILADWKGILKDEGLFFGSLEIAGNLISDAYTGFDSFANSVADLVSPVAYFNGDMENTWESVELFADTVEYTYDLNNSGFSYDAGAIWGATAAEMFNGMIAAAPLGLAKLSNSFRTVSKGLQSEAYSHSLYRTELMNADENLSYIFSYGQREFLSYPSVNSITGAEYGSSFLGNPTVVRAVVDAEFISGGQKAASNIKPPGFDVELGFERGHLLGKGLGGKGHGDLGRRNLASQYDEANDYQSFFEDAIAQRVQDGNTASFVIKGVGDYNNTQNPILKGTTIYARDSGGLNLNVTILNKQYGTAPIKNFDINDYILKTFKNK